MKKKTKNDKKNQNQQKQTHGDSNLYRLKTLYHRPDVLAIEWRRYKDIGYSKIHIHTLKEESESETDKTDTWNKNITIGKIHNQVNI